MEYRPFVFIDIPASFRQFLKLLLFPLFPRRRLSVLGCCAGQESRQLQLLSNAVGGSRYQCRAGQFIIHHTIPTCNRSSVSLLLNPRACPTPRSILAYLTQFVKRHRVPFGPPREALPRSMDGLPPSGQGLARVFWYSPCPFAGKRTCEKTNCTNHRDTEAQRGP